MASRLGNFQRQLGRKPLAGLTAIVTGSTSGIGLGIAQCLALEGVSVVMNGLGKKEEIDAAVNSVQERAQAFDEFVAKGANNGTGAAVSVPGPTITTYHGANLMKLDEMEDLVKFAKGSDVFGKHHGGKIDILINNAGIQHVAPIDEFTPEAWDRIISINLSSVFHMTRLCLPSMKENKFGRVINIASVHGLVASANKSAYVAAKHGVVGLTKVTALENATATNLTCNAVCPAWVLTPLVEKQVEARAQADGGISFDEAKSRLIGEKMPTKDFVSAEEIGRACMYFCDPENKGSTGTILTSDGGWTAQ